MKLLLVILILSAFALPVTAMADMEEHHKDHQMMDHSSEKTSTKDVNVEDAGNKTCPITGSPINKTDYVVYKGKKYGLCCAGCDKEFLKNPEKYIKLLRDKGEIK